MGWYFHPHHFPFPSFVISRNHVILPLTQSIVILLADLILFYVLLRDGAKGKPLGSEDVEDHDQAPQTARARTARSNHNDTGGAKQP
jgi:hypothetical protein